MNLYQITLYDPYERELERLELRAGSMALALLVSEARLRGSAAEAGAVSAQVDLVPEWERLAAGPGRCTCGTLWTTRPPEACPRCGRRMEEESALHSIRAELHEQAARAAVYDPREAEEFGHGLGEIDGDGE